MTNIDQSLKDYLLWLNAMRGQASEVVPLRIDIEANLMSRLVRKHHEYRAVRLEATSTQARLEANWQLIRERLHEAESGRAERQVRGDHEASATKSRGQTHFDSGGDSWLRKLGVNGSSLQLGAGAIVVALLVAFAAMWSIWRSGHVAPTEEPSFGEPRLRGEDMQRIRTANPVAYADEITKVLGANGIAVRRVELVDSHGKATGAVHLQAKVPLESPAIPQLKPLGIVVPITGQLDLLVFPSG